MKIFQLFLQAEKERRGTENIYFFYVRMFSPFN